MKLLKVVLCTLLFAVFFSTGASAESEAGKNDTDSLYTDQYNSLQIEDLNELLPKETTEAFKTSGIDFSDINSLKKINFSFVFSCFCAYLKDGIKTPLRITAAVSGIFMIFSSINAMWDNSKSEPEKIAVFAAVSLIILQPVCELIRATAFVIQTISKFMLGLIPVIAAIFVSSGRAAAAGSFSPVLLGTAEGMSQFVSFVFLPLINCFFSLSLCSGISPFKGFCSLCKSIQKFAVWGMGIATTLFLSLLSVQTSLSNAADNIGLKTSKAVISGALPVFGTAIAETLSTAQGCLSILRGSIGIYGVLAIVLTAMPVIIQLVAFNAGMFICTSVSEFLSFKGAGELLQAVRFCLSVLLGALCFSALLFILAIAAITRAGGN